MKKPGRAIVTGLALAAVFIIAGVLLGVEPTGMFIAAGVTFGVASIITDYRRSMRTQHRH